MTPDAAIRHQIELNPDAIVFAVIKCGAARVIVVRREHARKRSKVLPAFTVREMHGMVIYLTRIEGRAVVAYPCHTFKEGGKK